MTAKLARITGSGERDADERRQGAWEFSYLTGERYAAGEFKDGVRVGEWTYWYPNGQVAARGAHVHDGAHDVTGPWVYFHPNGTEAMRVTYDEIGFETGECREWYDTGQLACLTHYEMSDEDGPITLWHPNGTKMAEGVVECDCHVGTWRYWHDNGQLAFVEVKDEVEPREGYFDRDGNAVGRDESAPVNSRETSWVGYSVSGGLM